jgi:hypothetical protein
LTNCITYSFEELGAVCRFDLVVEQYVVATFPGCAVRVLPDAVQPFDYGLAFSANTSDEIVDMFSYLIIKYQEDNTVDDLEAKYMFRDSKCLDTSTKVSGIDVRWPNKSGTNRALLVHVDHDSCVALAVLDIDTLNPMCRLLIWSA